MPGDDEVGTYKVEGIGYDFVPEVLQRAMVDTWVKTEDRESFLLARRLIAEEGLLAGGSTCVGLGIAVGFTIVALFASVHTTVATALHLTTRRAAIAIIGVAVVAFFEVRIFRRQVGALNVVAATSLLATRGAGIKGDGVAVVAGFLPLPNDVVATTGGCAGAQTRIRIHTVAVIAGFTVLNNAITAGGGNTI